MLPLATFWARPSRFSLFSMMVGDGRCEVALGLRYGDHVRHGLDVYRPRGGHRGADAPVALFLYGGSWRGGCRSCYGFVGAALAARGIVTAVVDYRLFPEVRYPAFMEDAAAAYRWVATHLADGSRRPIVLIGHSAGAHMAALLAFDQRWLTGLPRPAALVGLSGPYTFEPTTWPTTAEIFATAADTDQPRPIAHVSDRAPAALLVHGAADDLVEPRNTHELAAALRRAGRPVEEVHLAGAGHRHTVLGFAWPANRLAPVADLIGRFIASQPWRHTLPAWPLTGDALVASARDAPAL